MLVDGLGIALDDSVLLSRAEFTRLARTASAAKAASDTLAIFYVHGYSTSLHECWRYVAEARIRSRAGIPWIAFCWPSNGSGIATPTRGALFDRAYRDDSSAAVASIPAFQRAARVVLDAVPASRLLLVAHSMGAQLISGSLGDTTALHAHLAREPAKAIVFVAPDVDARLFADSIVSAIQPLTSRLVAYISGRDRMLALSRQRSGTQRAGLRQRVPLVRPGLESVDVTDGLVAESGFQRAFGTHHSIRRASSLVFDLTHVVGAGRSPECRTALGTAEYSVAAGWQLTSRRPDLANLGERCPVVPHAR